ncbi:hypothetical protein [Acutalibacter muris]|uniref:hypothetical protein n=1 Tax=Acutalibacter muris TaxID=1796620 RepID=UPI0026F3A72D|nr:hypothetical protein [Acutalibacter muris]
MDEEIRKAGDYTIIHSLHIGDREVVLGENQENQDGQKFMCAFCTSNWLFARYDDVLTSDDYPEIVTVYGQRIAEQAEKTRVDLSKPKFQGIPNAPLTEKDCTPISYNDDLNGKIIVIKPDVLRREYRMATQQIKLCTGGFGASPNSRGSACCCVDLYSGKESRFERVDVLGTLEQEQLPEWAKLGLVEYRQKQQKSKEQGAR